MYAETSISPLGEAMLADDHCLMFINMKTKWIRKGSSNQPRKGRQQHRMMLWLQMCSFWERLSQRLSAHLHKVLSVSKNNKQRLILFHNCLMDFAIFISRKSTKKLRLNPFSTVFWAFKRPNRQAFRNIFTFFWIIRCIYNWIQHNPSSILQYWCNCWTADLHSWGYADKQLGIRSKCILRSSRGTAEQEEKGNQVLTACSLGFNGTHLISKDTTMREPSPCSNLSELKKCEKGDLNPHA